MNRDAADWKAAWFSGTSARRADIMHRIDTDNAEAGLTAGGFWHLETIQKEPSRE
jgi:hypothetical protein